MIFMGKIVIMGCSREQSYVNVFIYPPPLPFFLAIPPDNC